MSKLYVGNLNPKITDETLRNVFSYYGHITEAIFMKDNDTGKF